MTEQPLAAWALDRPVAGNPFAWPRGLPGRLAGRVMAVTNRREQREAADLLSVRPGERVLEIGYGPGLLLARVIADGAASVAGVDPSPEMQRLARNRLKAGPRTADLRLGTAAETGFPDASFDAVVTVNNVAIWPDLDAALHEIRRVLRAGGRAVVAWHGGTAPSRAARNLVLPAAILDRIEAGLAARFAGVTRHELGQLTAFVATC